MKRAKATSVIEKRNPFWEARTRILAWYIALMSFFLVLSVPLIYQLVFHQVERRVEESLIEEIEAFEEFVKKQRLRGDNVDILFDRFLSSRIPEDDNFLLTFINQRFYRSSAPRLPEPLQQNEALLERWGQLTTISRGEIPTSNLAIGAILYIAKPVVIEEEVQAVLVVVHTTAGELREAQAALLIVIEVLLAVLVLALFLTWIASGKVLEPLRSLSQAARQISETDLTKRIPVQGKGEIAEIAMTFNAMMERLQKAFESQQDFVNDAGHELRTPITIIRGHLELLDDDPKERQETIELVLDELDRMTRFVNDLILLAKAEQQDFLKLENIEIESLCQQLYAKAQALAPRYWLLEATSRGQIVADRQRITQAVMNLAQNATQHTQEADTIVIGATREQDSVRFWVRDTGDGIHESAQQHIFERFARTAKSRRRSEGAGLGLAIVRAIAQAHGGRVELCSQPGVGSTFALILPLNPSKLVKTL